MATYKKKKRGSNTGNAEESSSTAELFNTLDEGASRTEQWVLKNQKTIISMLLFASSLVVGYWAYVKYIQLPKNIMAIKVLANSETIFENAVNSTVRKERDSLFNLALNGDENNIGFLNAIEEYSGISETNLLFYKVGMSFFNLGDYEKSIFYLQKFDSKGDVLLGSLSLMTVGDALVQQKRLEDGLEYYNKAIEYNKNSLSTPIALFKAGQVAMELGKKEDALAFFTSIKENHPKSEEARTIDIYIAQASF